jgi:hypothetical protein
MILPVVNSLTPHLKRTYNLYRIVFFGSGELAHGSSERQRGA